MAKASRVITAETHLLRVIDILLQSKDAERVALGERLKTLVLVNKEEEDGKEQGKA